MTAAPVTPFDEGQFREAGLRWTGDEMDQDGHLPDYVRDDAASPHGLSAHGAERAWAAAPHGRLDFGQAPLRRGAPSLGSSSSPPLSRAPSLSSRSSTAAEGYMMLDDFTRLVEASASPGEFSREVIAQVFEQTTRVRPSALYGTVAAVAFTNTRGKAFFMGDVDGLGLVIGIPSHLAAFMTNAPTRNQIIADIVRFAMKNLQNYKFFPSIAVARAWAYSSLVTVGARSSEAKTFSTMTVKPFLQFALECGCSPIEIMRACPFAPMPSKPRQKRKLVTATGSAIDSLLNDTAAAAARTEATAVHPLNMTEDLIAARDASSAAP
ncbi:hypothetical protein M885DRAFT_303147 [Pelagophyceae sp. CCMP2097]|nr:hypothetical protein M885DRAFT_303147 [Pelagophyceae sp. CCMP2097]